MKFKIILNFFYIYFCIYFAIFREKKTISKPKNNIKVSVFLPIYNKASYLQRSIWSVQSQTLKDIEIIAVNDFSTDNSLKILKKMAKKDKRIKIVNNDRNHGLLYSRAMGILNSTGEYIMNLDPDDKFYSSENLKELYYIAKHYKTGLVKFLIKFIPSKEKKELSYNFNKNQLKSYDFFIYNKFVKREIFLKAYEKFKKKIHYLKWNYYEDNIWSLLIYKYTKKYIIFDEYVYVYKINQDSLIVNRRGNRLEIKNHIYRLQTIQDLNINAVNFPFSFRGLVKYCYPVIILDKEIRKRVIHMYAKIRSQIFNKSKIIN